MVVVIALPTQNVGVGPVGVTVNVTVTAEVVVLVKVVPIIFPEPLDAIPVTALVLSLVHANVVDATELLVLNVIVVKPAPEQIVWLLLVDVATGIGFTVTVTVPVICKLHPVAAIVARTLYVVVAVKFPVGRFIVAPFPATALPILELSALFLN